MLEEETSSRDLTPVAALPPQRRIRYTEALADRICQAIANTPAGLHQICAAHPGLPSPNTIFQWYLNRPDFAQKYARARELQAELLAYEQLRIADTIREGKKTERKEVGRECSGCGVRVKWIRGVWRHTTEGNSLLCDGAEARKIIEEKIVTGDMVERARLQIDARKWLASKLAPRVYGDRQQIDQRLVDGEGRDRPFTRRDYDQMVRQAEREEAEERRLELEADRIGSAFPRTTRARDSGGW